MTIRIGSDDAERQVLADVERYGWHSLNILEEGESAAWRFSIGFFQTWQFPELIVVGLKREVAHELLHIVATGLKNGVKPDLGSVSSDLLNGYACCFVEVPKELYAQYVGTAMWYYGGRNFPLYQIVWPSKDGHFPWHPNASESFIQWQSVLGKAPIGV